MASTGGAWVAAAALATAAAGGGCDCASGCGQAAEAAGRGSAPVTEERQGAGDPTAVEPSPVPAPPPPSEGGGGGPAIPCPEEGARDGSGAVSIRWSAVRSTGGCFFFSGPGTLGRDTPLGGAGRLARSEAGVTLEIGAARFEGTGAPRLALRREASYAFSGAWRTTETIEGEWLLPATRTQADTPCAPAPRGAFRGTYRYREQAPSQRVPGPCTIEAVVEVHPTRAP